MIDGRARSPKERQDDVSRFVSRELPCSGMLKRDILGISRLRRRMRADCARDGRGESFFQFIAQRPS